jgi:transcriptional regulator with XRE-family HTH domain
MLEPTVFGPGGRERPRPLLRTMLGEVLRRTRLEQRRTLADVARVARVSMPYLSEVERGRKEASSEVLAAICESLHIDLSDLLAEVGRDLIDLRMRRTRARAQLVRLDDIRAGRISPPQQPQQPQRPSAPAQRGPASPQCLLAA